MTPLTQKEKACIVDNMMAATNRVDYTDQIVELAQGHFLKKMPADMQKMVETGKNIHMVNKFMVRLPGVGRTPIYGCDSENPVFPKRLKERMQRLGNKMEVQKLAVITCRAKIAELLRNIETHENLKKYFPEAAEFLPTKTQRAERYPHPTRRECQLLIQDLKSIGWKSRGSAIASMLNKKNTSKRLK